MTVPDWVLKQRKQLQHEVEHGKNRQASRQPNPRGVPQRSVSVPGFTKPAKRGK